MSSRQIHIFQEKPGDSFIKELSTAWFNNSTMCKMPAYKCEIKPVDNMNFEVIMDMQNKVKIAFYVGLKESNDVVSLYADSQILKKPLTFPKIMVDNLVATFNSELSMAITQMKK